MTQTAAVPELVGAGAPAAGAAAPVLTGSVTDGPAAAGTGGAGGEPLAVRLLAAPGLRPRSASASVRSLGRADSRARRAPGAVGQHVRVHRGVHLHGRAGAGGRVRLVPGLLHGPVRFAAGRTRARHRSDLVYTPAGSLVPALQSYWIAIHVTAMIIAIGLFIFGAVVTTLYLLAGRSERRIAAGQPSASAGIWQHLPRPVDPGPAGLPRRPVRLPGLDLRRHGRRDLGRPRLGPVLGLGPEGDLVVHHLGRLRHVPACAGNGGLARAPGGLDPADRLRLPDVQRRRASTCGSPACTPTPA